MQLWLLRTQVSFNFGIVVRRPLSSSLKKVSSEENVLSIFVLFQCRFSVELNSRPLCVCVCVYNSKRLYKNILREI